MRSPSPADPRKVGAELVIRRSRASDRSALARLAQLDSQAAPAGPYLLAEEDGELRVALPLGGGRPMADPFHPTADLVAMLELRVARPGRPGRARRPGGARVPRPLPLSRAGALGGQPAPSP